MLRGGCKEAETEDVYKVKAINFTAIQHLLSTADNLLCRLNWISVHADSSRKVICSAHWDYSERIVHTLATHCIYDIVNRTIATANNHKVVIRRLIGNPSGVLPMCATSIK